MEKILRKTLLRQIHVDIETLNRFITCKDFEVVIYKIPEKERPGSGGFTGDCYKHLKKN